MRIVSSGEVILLYGQQRKVIYNPIYRDNSSILNFEIGKKEEEKKKRQRKLTRLVYKYLLL